MWSRSVKDEVLVACGRCCCLCHRFCGVKMELHHIQERSNGGDDTFDNCIPLCFDCHAEVGHYNVKHPKGIKFSSAELKGHRDKWYEVRKNLRVEEARTENEDDAKPIEIYEGQEIELEGFVWRETFPGPPNYESLLTDSKETYWMFILPKPITLNAESFEHGNTVRIEGIKKLQLKVESEFYDANREIVRTTVRIKGTLIPSHTGHHHGQALFDVIEITGGMPNNQSNKDAASRAYS